MITSFVTNTLIKTIGSITTGIGNAIESETGQKVIAETKNAVGKAVKPIASAGMEIIDERKLHSDIKEYSNKKELLAEIYSRTSEEEGIELSNDELKKLINFFDKPENAMFILFRYFLLLFAVRIRGLKYQKELDETRGLLKCVLYKLNHDEAMLNLRYEEIAIASRNIIPQVINNINAIILNLIHKKEERMIKKEENKMRKEETKKEAKQKPKEKNIFVSIAITMLSIVIFFIVFTIIISI